MTTPAIPTIMTVTVDAPSTTLAKKIVGTAGAMIASAAFYLADPANVKALQALFPHDPRAVYIIGVVGVFMAYRGKHLGSAPSIKR